MKFLTSLLLAYCFISLFVSSSCRKGGKCEQAPDVNQSEIIVAFKDAITGKYLYSEVNPIYSRDSLKIFADINNNITLLYSLNQIPNTSSRYWDISFGNIYNSSTDNSSFSTEICKNYIVKYRYNEIDTIRVCFKSKNTECGSVFETLKVYHKGILLGAVSGKTSINITINK